MASILTASAASSDRPSLAEITLRRHVVNHLVLVTAPGLFECFIRLSLKVQLRLDLGNYRHQARISCESLAVLMRQVGARWINENGLREELAWPDLHDGSAPSRAVEVPGIAQ